MGATACARRQSETSLVSASLNSVSLRAPTVRRMAADGVDNADDLADLLCTHPNALPVDKPIEIPDDEDEASPVPHQKRRKRAPLHRSGSQFAPVNGLRTSSRSDSRSSISSLGGTPSTLVSLYRSLCLLWSCHTHLPRRILSCAVSFSIDLTHDSAAARRTNSGTAAPLPAAAQNPIQIDLDDDEEPRVEPSNLPPQDPYYAIAQTVQNHPALSQTMMQLQLLKRSVSEVHAQPVESPSPSRPAQNPNVNVALVYGDKRQDYCIPKVRSHGLDDVSGVV